MREVRSQVTVILAATLVAAPIAGAIGLGADAPASGPVEPVAVAEHGEDHPPIRIHGDEQFLSPTSGVTGGSGTADDPYVMSGWTVKPLSVRGLQAKIDAFGEKCKPTPPVSASPWAPLLLHGIEIVGTTKHVVIEDVTVLPRTPRDIQDPGGAIDSKYMIGILLRDADHVTVRNVTVGKADGPRIFRGICAQGSDDLTVRDSTVQRTVYHPVDVKDGREVAVVNNTVRDSKGYSRKLDQSAGVLADSIVELGIRGNRVSHHATYGIKLIGSDGAKLTYNTVDAIGDNAIVLGGTDDALVSANVLRTSKIGLKFSSATAVIAHNNTLADNADFGLYAFESDVDARDNWWGDDSGPSGGVTDACEGTVADGDGDAIEAGGGASVCFDPWLTSPNDDAGA